MRVSPGLLVRNWSVVVPRTRLPMGKPLHPSQVSPVGWYIASYIERIDPVEAYDAGESHHQPWAVWENRILVKASTPDEALRRTNEHLADIGYEYINADGVLVRNSVVGLTSLLPIFEELEDGNEIEWIDHTGESLVEMNERVRANSELEAFTVPKNAKLTAAEQDTP